MTCEINDCYAPVKTNGMCSRHYQRWWKHGNPHYVPPNHYNSPPIDRLHANSVRRAAKLNQEIGCLEFLGCGKRKYAVMQIGYKQTLVHRVSWTIEYGEIPEGMLVCHHCDNTRCIEPTHLFVGTNLDNNKDMIRKGRWKPRGKTKHALL